MLKIEFTVTTKINGEYITGKATVFENVSAKTLFKLRREAKKITAKTTQTGKRCFVRIQFQSEWSFSQEFGVYGDETYYTSNRMDYYYNGAVFRNEHGMIENIKF